MTLIFVDVESDGPAPGVAVMTEFGAVDFKSRDTFHGYLIQEDEADHDTMLNFEVWLKEHVRGRAVMVSDNPAFDFQWINYYFWNFLGRNPFGHSARRIGDYYAGLVSDFYKTQEWKNLRKTPHDHNPVNDAMGNVEAFERLQAGERP